MEAYLNESGIGNVTMVTLRDGPSVAWSIDNLIRRCKPDLLFLSNEKRALARQVGRKVRVVRFARTGRISSTRIRDLIAVGDPAWKRLTGKSVARLIERAGGVGRIRRAYRAPRSRTRSGQSS